MANEISASCALTAVKGGAQASGAASWALNLAGTEMIASVQNFGTANSQGVSIGGCDQVQSIMIRNMDTTNNLTVSLDGTHTQVVSVIPPGASILLSNASLTLFAKSSAATVDAFVVAVET